jgi:type I restriction-modification system DNA methylase subunit
LFTPAVKQVVEWYNADKDVYPIQTEGASLGGRAASRLGGDPPQKVAKFTDILSREEFPEDDWNEVHVLLAMPTDEDDPDYELYAEIADTALQAGFVVKNLSAGLDDIVVIEPEDATKDEEPEPEPERPARRRRGRAADMAEEPAEEEKPAPKRTRAAKKAETVEEVQEVVKGADPEPEDVDDKSQQIRDAYAAIKSIHDALALALDIIGKQAVAAEEPTKVPEAEEAPKRGRGRPRTDFDVRQIWDEDKEDWVPRPKGRLKKGTEWRTIHAETDEVLEEGTA